MVVVDIVTSAVIMVMMVVSAVGSDCMLHIALVIVVVAFAAVALDVFVKLLVEGCQNVCCYRLLIELSIVKAVHHAC